MELRSPAAPQTKTQTSECVDVVIRRSAHAGRRRESEVQQFLGTEVEGSTEIEVSTSRVADA